MLAASQAQVRGRGVDLVALGYVSQAGEPTAAPDYEKHRAGHLRQQQETLEPSLPHRKPARHSRGQTLVLVASPSAILGTFNSLPKVLFILPSWYLFAIGLGPMFSLRRELPPLWRSTSKEHESADRRRARTWASETGLSPSPVTSSNNTYTGNCAGIRGCNHTSGGPQFSA